MARSLNAIIVRCAASVRENVLGDCGLGSSLVALLDKQLIRFHLGPQPGRHRLNFFSALVVNTCSRSLRLSSLASRVVGGVVFCVCAGSATV
jgi:hypothetical protein